MDFEFTNYQRNKIVLISGAIANSYIDSRVEKLQGTPLIIAPNGQISLLSYDTLKATLKLLRKIF